MSRLDSGLLLEEVSAIVGTAGILDLAGYAIDGVRPLVVARPADRDEVARLLALAQGVGAHVIPWGGGTLIDAGLPPRGVDLVMVLDRLDRVIEHEPADLTVTVEAGITLAKLQATLAARGQNLGLDAPLAERATIGG
ncbi:MAG TPA: FAD-dependent oxidoreductase, partial [Dehalococcoidia bacterium]|nr:FAD-dependent oxidoreductase [Dehalococcoidia bacterium]